MRRFRGMSAVGLLVALSLLAQQPDAKRKPAPSNDPRLAAGLATAEALWKAGDFKGASKAFGAIVVADPANANYRVRWAQLFFERFNPADATKLYLEALEIDPQNAQAWLGLAEVQAEEFNSKAAEAADKALAIDPKLYRAHEIKARMALEDDDHKGAAKEADLALEIEPNALQAIAIHAALDLLDDKPSVWTAKIGNRAEGYASIAHFFVLNRRYEDGIAYYRKAIAANPQLWSAHSELGVNLMRLGLAGEARTELELSYENHHDDKPTVNTLRLMDSYADYNTVETPGIVLKLHKKEDEALRPYFEAEIRRAMNVFEKKYQHKLPQPVQVEVYPNHEDFAVRTMGMPGLGALGVTFHGTSGNAIAMDSPSGRPPGQFHWASTLWHELSHMYILSLTNDRVVRWFTEGLAVHEETATNADWGDRITPDIIVAIRDKKLLPVAEIDRGFIHPKFPEQVIVSYFQAGKICDYIAKRWGEGKLLDIAREFAKNRPTVDVIRDQLKMEPEAFDKDFLADLEKETEVLVKNFKEWTTGLGELNKLARATPPDNDAIIAKGRALDFFYPDYVEAGNAYVLVAKALLAKNDKAGAMAEYAKYSQYSGRDAETIKAYADLLKESGNSALAEKELERLNAVNPLDRNLHERLGALYLASNQAKLATREFGAVVALNPIDVAGSHYNLAMAYKAQGLIDKAREETLVALEAAPDFRPAQKLLLQLETAAEPKK